MILRFVKMQGVGNDYVYVDARRRPVPQPAQLAPRLADRHFGIGGDGLVLLERSAVADVKMRMFNADGSEGKMCGNAVRCIAKYLFDEGVMSPQVTVETLSGVKVVTRLPGDVYQVEMGAVRVLACGRQCARVDVGNPHLVIFPALPLPATLDRIGGQLARQHDVNVEFARVVAANQVQVRVWERGSGETLGCGTGAVAVAVAAVRLGLCDRRRPVQVNLPGGTLTVNVGEQTTLTGNAVTVFRGEIKL